MVPNQIMTQIREFYGLMQANRPVMELLANNMPGIKKRLAEEVAYEKQICTQCQFSQLYFDLITPDSEKTTWEAVIRITMRCGKLMEKFVVDNIYVGSKETPLPGQFTFRLFCPQFEPYEEEKEAPADAQDD